MNPKLTAAQQQFIAHARAEIESAIARRKPHASKKWIDRLASETGPMQPTKDDAQSVALLSPAEMDERVVAQALQSLFADITHR